MKRYLWVLFALSATVGAGIWLVATRPVVATRPPPPVMPAIPTDGTRTQFPANGANVERHAPPAGLEQAPTQRTDGKLVAVDGTKTSVEAGGLAFSSASPAEAKERIQQLAVTFDVAHVPTLARYLEHPMEEVRLEAASGLVLLGETAAVPYLQAAANRAELSQSSTETTAMREAAALLAKPRLNEPKMPRAPLSDGTRQEARVDLPQEGRAADARE